MTIKWEVISVMTINSEFLFVFCLLPVPTNHHHCFHSYSIVYARIENELNSTINESERSPLRWWNQLSHSMKQHGEYEIHKGNRILLPFEICGLNGCLMSFSRYIIIIIPLYSTVQSEIAGIDNSIDRFDDFSSHLYLHRVLIAVRSTWIMNRMLQQSSAAENSSCQLAGTVD